MEILCLFFTGSLRNNSIYTLCIDWNHAISFQFEYCRQKSTKRTRWILIYVVRTLRFKTQMIFSSSIAIDWQNSMQNFYNYNIDFGMWTRIWKISKNELAFKRSIYWSRCKNGQSDRDKENKRYTIAAQFRLWINKTSELKFEK